MKQPVWLGVLVVMVFVQWAVPVGMMARREATLKQGEVFKFKTRPVDPYDAFRGRYVALDYDVSTVPASLMADPYMRKMKAWAVLGTGTNGFAVIEKVQRRRPVEGAFIPVRVNYRNKGVLHLRLPLDRYYMNEKDAPEAERVYRARNRGDQRNAHVVVRVRKGLPVIEALMIGEITIEQYMIEQANKDAKRS